MLLNEIIGQNRVNISLNGSLNIDVKGIAFDSREVQPGFLFIAIKGFKTDGHMYINKAIEKGACAIAVEDLEYFPTIEQQATYIYTSDNRYFLSLASSNFYKNPSKKLKTFGITGTNGKTTSVFMVSSILKACGFKHSVISTVGNRVLDVSFPPSTTTPESIVIHELLCQTLKQGGEYAVIECSSHGIEMNRLAHVYFDYIGYTNITYDHMDKHGSIDSYFEVKKSLMKNLKDTDGWLTAINNDDSYLSTITNNVLPYGIDQNAPITAKNIKLNKFFTTFTLVTPEKNVDIKLNTPGLYNVYNALNAATLTYMDGIPVEKIKEGIESFKNVDGRMDFIENDFGINIIVDFAHNPDGLENIFKTAKDIFDGDILMVSGLSFYKDPDKHTLIGKVANKYCKLSVLTTEVADFFDPMDIVSQIAAAMDKDKYIIEMDRYKAIKLGISLCKPGDTVFILGRGHFTHLRINGERIPFKDADVARAIVTSLSEERSQQVAVAFDEN